MKDGISTQQNCVITTKTVWAAKSKILTVWTLPKEFANSCSTPFKL